MHFCPLNTILAVPRLNTLAREGGELWDLLYGAVHEAWHRTILVEAML
jgi:hypothetical protein